MKKYIIVIISVIYSFLWATMLFAATDTWIQRADFGGTARWTAVGFSIGGKGYIGTGWDGSSILKKDFWEYDPIANTWTQKADFAGTVRRSAVGFSIGSKGYIGTGWDGSTLKKDFWEYDPIANAWIQRADFGGTARYGAIGFSLGSKGYIGTGAASSSLKKDFWEYDPIANAWIQRADFGGTARAATIGFSIGGKGYIGTGWDGSSILKKDFWEYDPIANTWTQKADFGGTVRESAVGFSIENKGYIGTGGDGPSSNKNDFWEYDPIANAWIQRADFGGTARWAAVGFSIGSKGYIGTGHDGSAYRKDFWEYDGDGYLALNSPANNAQITTPTLTFSWSHPDNVQYELKIKDDGGITVYKSGKISAKSNTVDLAAFPLTYGKTYRWYVVVYEDGQESSSENRYFTYIYQKIVEPEATSNQIYVICIGAYHDNGKGIARSDLAANEVAKKFKPIAGENNVHVFDGSVNGQGIDKDKILEKINSLKLRSGDTLIIYIAGHGGVFSGLLDCPVPVGSAFVQIGPVACPDATKGVLTEKDLYSYLTAMDNVSKWVIIDACSSGGFWDSLKNLENVILYAAVREKGMLSYTPILKDSIGFFSSILINGLTRNAFGTINADLNFDKRLASWELSAYFLSGWALTYIKSHWGTPVMEMEFGDQTIFTDDIWNPHTNYTKGNLRSLGIHRNIAPILLLLLN